MKLFCRNCFTGSLPLQWYKHKELLYFLLRAAMKKTTLSLPAAWLPLSLLALVLCAGCDTTTEEPYVERPVDALYNEGLAALHDNNYAGAAKAFDEVERQHPYSPWASRAQLMAAYADYTNGQYDDALNALDRFIQIHPGHADIAYAYYLKALCYYDQIADVGRDQSNTEKAMAALKDVVRRFPNTSYARDATAKISLAVDHLAGKEMEIGRYYLSQKYYIAALGRFRKVVESYQNTGHTPEALHRLVETDLALGLLSEAQHAAAVLGYNFPGSTWYQDSYALLQKQGLAPKEAPASWLKRNLIN